MVKVLCGPNNHTNVSLVKHKMPLVVLVCLSLHLRPNETLFPGRKRVLVTKSS